MKSVKYFGFICMLYCIICMSGCGDSKYSGRWYCGNDIELDLDMDKKTVSIYSRYSKSRSSLPSFVREVKILSENDRGVMFEFLDSGGQFRIEDGKFYFPSGFKTLICTKDPNKNYNRKR